MLNTQEPIVKTFYLPDISSEVQADSFITMEVAKELFEYFKSCSLFRWGDANNDCEDRANALCMLLDNWRIPNYKGWVFSGYFLKKDLGSLQNFWNFHVAPLIPVRVGNNITHYIIDPATSHELITISDWAANITNYPYSYYAITKSDVYIFSIKRRPNRLWYKRNKRNFRWTIQGLSGVNGISTIGKAYLRFNKLRVTKTLDRFNKLKNERPGFL